MDEEGDGHPQRAMRSHSAPAAGRGDPASVIQHWADSKIARPELGGNAAGGDATRERPVALTKLHMSCPGLRQQRLLSREISWIVQARSGTRFLIAL